MSREADVAPKYAHRAGPLNVIEQWFSILTRKLLRRGSFESQEDLENRITEFTIGYNKTARPWKWKYDAGAEHARYLQRQNVTMNPSGISDLLH